MARRRTLLLLLAAPALAADAAENATPEDEPWRIAAESSQVVRAEDGSRVISFVDEVIILHGELTITADAARYLDVKRRALLTGHVVMTQDSTVVRAPSALYDRETRVARFPAGIVIERPSGTAVADAGWWWRDEKKFELRGRAAAADTSGTLDADSLTIDSAADVFYAAGSAKLVDDVTGVVVEAENLRYDRAARLATAIGEPRTTFVDDDSVTVAVTAERMTYDPDRNVATAFGDVRVRRESVEATAGQGTFWRDEDRFVLTEGPELVDGATVVTGESVELRMLGPGRREVRVRGAARVANRFLEDRERPEPMPEAPSLEETRERIGEDAAKIPAQPPPDAAALDAEPMEPPPGTTPEAAVTKAVEASEESAEPAEPAEETPKEEQPAWLTIPSAELPTENLLFGDDVVMVFEDDALQRVRVVGHTRSKFFPNEKEGELTEWNDVIGDTLHVWFTNDEVDSVIVLGNGVGEYRLPADEDSVVSTEKLQELGKLVRYQAPTIRWDRPAEMMHLDDGAKVDYKTMTLSSGKIDFDAKAETMEAGGNPTPTLVDRGDEVIGETMRYHMPTEKGEILRGKTQFENGYYTGTDIWRMGENELAVQDAEYTTCDLDHSHYHFACKQMKIYPDDKMVAKPVILKVRDIPVFALPYYMTSLSKDRRSGFLLPRLELGVDDARGRFIRNLGYYWVPNDYADAWTSFDFYPEREQIVTYLNARYAVRYRFRGSASVKYNRDVPADTKETAVELEHAQTFSETMELRGSGRFVTSSSIYQNIDDAQRLDRELKSRATLSKRFEGSKSLNVEVEREENLDTGRVSETLPLVVYSQPSTPFAGRREYLPDEQRGRGIMDVTYYTVGARFVNDRNQPETGPRDDHVGSQGDLRLSSTLEMSRYLNLSPAVTAEGTWIDVDKQGNRNALRSTYATSVAANTTIYGTFLGESGPMRGLRHVVTPTVTWGWAPEFDRYFFTNDSTGVEEDRFFTFGGISGTRRKTNSMSFALGNLLQTKLAQGEEEKRYDFLNLRTSINYNFLAKDVGARPLSSLSNQMTVLTASPVNQTWSVAHDPYDWRLLSSSVTTRARISSNMFTFRRDSSADPTPMYDDYGDPSGPGSDPVGAGRGRTPSMGRYQGGAWSLDASHSMQRTTASSRSSNLVINSRWSPSSKWEVVFNTQYDLRTGVNTRQDWSVVRIVHCWELSFSRRLLGGNWQYSFRINVTDLPDIQAERGQFTTGRSSTSLPGQDLF